MLKINEWFSIMSILGFCAEALAENYGICEAFSCNITKYAFNYMCWGFELQPGRPIGEVSAWGSLVYQVRTLNVCWALNSPTTREASQGDFGCDNCWFPIPWWANLGYRVYGGSSDKFKSWVLYQ